jgi:hypothetical protein
VNKSICVALMQEQQVSPANGLLVKMGVARCMVVVQQELKTL